MTIAEILEKMIVTSDGNRHDTAHLLKVWGCARSIGQLEGLDDGTQFILETAAILHDIACPLCRRKYGSAPGKLQEQEGPALAEAFLDGCGLTPEQVSRVSWLVGHHHTTDPVDGIDHRILLEADYLVNADESSYTKEHILRTRDGMFRTESGKRMLDALCLKEE